MSIPRGQYHGLRFWLIVTYIISTLALLAWIAAGCFVIYLSVDGMWSYDIASAIGVPRDGVRAVELAIGVAILLVGVVKYLKSLILPNLVQVLMDIEKSARHIAELVDQEAANKEQSGS